MQNEPNELKPFNIIHFDTKPIGYWNVDKGQGYGLVSKWKSTLSSTLEKQFDTRMCRNIVVNFNPILRADAHEWVKNHPWMINGWKTIHEW